jgi:hypothetical protein
MSELQRARLRILSDQDQDAAMCQTWWDEASEADKLAIWMHIQQDFTHLNDGNCTEIMSRFAQLAFCQMLLQDPRYGGTQ